MESEVSSIEAALKAAALNQGFDLAGIASLKQPPAALSNLDPWLAAGHQASMAWMQRQRDKRLDPTLVLPGAASMLCVGLVYHTDQPLSTQKPDQPWISRYAWGDDYHDIMDSMLQRLEARVQALLPGVATRRYVDTGPISEKAWAAAAGLGWIGKHSNLINRAKGSWFFLGEILIAAELAADPPVDDLCGSCTRCLQACPTDAFPQPYVLDARRCVSHTSIELRGDFSPEQEASLGANLYGCDICQDVCPWNRQAPLTSLPGFQPRPHNLNPDLDALQQLSDEAFARLYRKSPIKRAKKDGLKRNARAVSKNLANR